MDLQRASIPIERRTTGACLDLAAQFNRVHFKQTLGMTLIFIALTAPLVYWVCSKARVGWWFTPLLFFFMSGFLGALLVAGAGPRVFGESFTVAGAWRSLRGNRWRLFGWVLWSRFLTILAAVGLIFPGIIVGVRYGFLPEMILLERTRGERFQRRLVELTVDTRTGLTGRWVALGSLFILLGWVLYFSLDIAFDFFGYPVLTGRIATFGITGFFDLLFFDPWVQTLWIIVLWLLYPLTRLAWFLCYLDVRIRKECWDVELEFRREAVRLSEPLPGSTYLSSAAKQELSA